MRTAIEGDAKGVCLLKVYEVCFKGAVCKGAVKML